MKITPFKVMGKDEPEKVEKTEKPLLKKMEKKYSLSDIKKIQIGENVHIQVSPNEWKMLQMDPIDVQFEHVLINSHKNLILHADTDQEIIFQIGNKNIMSINSKGIEIEAEPEREQVVVADYKFIQDLGREPLPLETSGTKLRLMCNFICNDPTRFTITNDQITSNTIPHITCVSTLPIEFTTWVASIKNGELSWYVKSNSSVYNSIVCLLHIV